MTVSPLARFRTPAVVERLGELVGVAVKSASRASVVPSADKRLVPPVATTAAFLALKEARPAEAVAERVEKVISMTRQANGATQAPILSSVVEAASALDSPRTVTYEPDNGPRKLVLESCRSP
jgi:hypothetical protein